MKTLQSNKYQKQAIAHKEGPCLVTSCPGSGKTFTLVERIVALIKSGVEPKNLLCITFTNKAANEMRERICDRLGIEKPGFFIGTFHALCAKMLRKIGPGRGYSANFTILADREQMDMVMQVSRHLGYDIKVGDARRIAHAVNFYRDQMENSIWVEERLKTAPMIEIAWTYLDRCRDNSMIDFSGLISEAIRIIEENQDIREKIQNTFKYILVDETQDTNKSQFYLVNLLGAKWKNIMLIGDIDQSIYGWRGARYQNIQEFMEMYPECNVISLSKNYRSTPEIIAVADKLIKRNSSHVKIKFETDNKSGQPVKCYSFGDQNKEAEWIGKMVKKLMEDGGWDPEDMAVLYRVNKMSEPVEQSLATAGIPYEVVGSWNFYDRKEARDCIAMLKLIANDRDAISFHRVASMMKGMGNITIGKIEMKAAAENIPLLDAALIIKSESNSVSIKKGCQEIYDRYNQKWDFSNPAKCLSTVVDKLEYSDYLHKKYGGDAAERLENVEQIVGACGEFTGNENGLNQYLQQIALVTSADKKNEGGKVSLMSLHAAKGLEFPVVFMIGVEHGILPHQQAVVDDPVSGLEEERRLCYVGMTRAKKVLYVTWCRNRKKFGKFGAMSYKSTKSSEFLKECGLMRDE